MKGFHCLRPHSQDRKLCFRIKTEFYVISNGAELICRGRDSTQPECIGLRPGLASEFGIEVVLASTGLLLLCLLRETWKPGSRLAKMLRPPNLAELPPHQHCHSLLHRQFQEENLPRSRLSNFGFEISFLCFSTGAQVSEAGAAGCSVLLHRTAAASSSSSRRRRQKGAEQQQRKAQQQPGCFALLLCSSSALHCTHHHCCCCCQPHSLGRRQMLQNLQIPTSKKWSESSLGVKC